MIRTFREDGLKKELAYRVRISIKGQEAEPEYFEFMSGGFIKYKITQFK